MGFDGKRIWIIGASAGIGEALARALAAEGASLILSARDGAALDRLAAEFKAMALPLDLADRDSLRRAVTRLEADPALDAVICTAALYHPGRVADLDPDQTEALVRVNLLGTLDVARLTPRLLRDGGQLVLFGSVAGYIGLPKGQAYSATKAGVMNLAETLRVELAPKVDVRLVSPGFVRSRLTDKNQFQMPAMLEPEDAARRILKGLQSRRFEIHFPKRFTLVLKLLRLLPYGLALRITGRMR